ncbi:hypothetical protein PPL_06490 [Heterostelium album PN500]|uniref:Uncharacterized protein n=1 Tax=Heterostelium pallidum (strain ATCC 26659 / Pp 5 / PN500) TaxID=670386 RepID=D3BDA7_HETP5|nr:hypothetical protein PPL_06490 [Heterostelium album PN500]EFA80551.1 hypothetical protein PPL_06490 [Heterostelium album PN500]|eukprot:XP_020432671.1 hypothetical protein PPL_06490 [Heterostelium album PN500]
MSDKSKLKNIDVYKRMNFLYQAAYLMKQTNSNRMNSTNINNDDNNSSSGVIEEQIDNSDDNNNNNKVVSDGNNNLSSFYCNVIKQISRRGVIRMNSRLKKTICKKCSSLMVPGVSSTVRIKDHRESHITLKCNNCNTVKRFQTNKHRENNKQKKLKKKNNINNNNNSDNIIIKNDSDNKQ